ncbi:hypothetical protein DERP_007810 [Dermatophagoides pteronyssinus]|uniref:Uncharacterized protein n=1 Tax=Dermatophagoides pteronyssinus TaxID=6956 RepID=A0ABQ8ISR8_DERPT|nr:hypothetical protein DERP_007810 [Dermatophagoides pteronyssinus]
MKKKSPCRRISPGQLYPPCTWERYFQQKKKNFVFLLRLFHIWMYPNDNNNPHHHHHGGLCFFYYGG